jgi:hypothetical protein
MSSAPWPADTIAREALVAAVLAIGEPTSSLTVSVQAMALNLLPRLQPEYGAPLLSAVPILHATAQRTRIRLKGNIPSPIDPPHPAAGAESAPGGPACWSTR